MTNLLQVSLNDRPVGTLAWLGGSVIFSFHEDYLNDPDRPVLSQSFFRPSGELVSETRSSSGILPAFFSNLLPEGHMRDYLAHPTLESSNQLLNEIKRWANIFHQRTQGIRQPVELTWHAAA